MRVEVNGKMILLAVLLAGTHPGVPPAVAGDLYLNDFNGPVGSQYAEWTSSAIHFTSTGTPPGKGVIASQVITNIESPNHAQRFLGELGGPPIGQRGDPGYNHTRV